MEVRCQLIDKSRQACSYCVNTHTHKQTLSHKSSLEALSLSVFLVFHLFPLDKIFAKIRTTAKQQRIIVDFST